MRSRTLAALLAVAAIFIGGGAVAAIAYNAGVSAAGGTPATAAAPSWAYGPHWGWGWGWGLGFLFPILFIIVTVLVLRAIFFGWAGPRRRGYGPGGYGPGGYGPGGYGPRPGDEPRFSPRDAYFDEWHRRAHEREDAGGTTPPPGAGSAGQ